MSQSEPQGGELVLDLGEEETLEGKILAVWQGDIGIPFSTLIRWTEGHGALFRLGRVAEEGERLQGFLVDSLALEDPQSHLWSGGAK